MSRRRAAAVSALPSGGRRAGEDDVKYFDDDDDDGDAHTEPAASVAAKMSETAVFPLRSPQKEGRRALLLSESEPAAAVCFWSWSQGGPDTLECWAASDRGSEVW